MPILRWEWILSGERQGRLGPWHEFPTYDDRVVFETEVPESEKERILAEREAQKRSAGKGKEKAVVEEESEEDEDEDEAESEDDEMDGLDLEQFVICTLDTEAVGRNTTLVMRSR